MRGWQVRIERKGQSFYRGFSDAFCDGSDKALQAAIACRDAVLSDLRSGKSIADAFAAHAAHPRQKKEPDHVIKKRDKAKACIYRLQTDDGWFLKFRRAGKDFFRTFPDKAYQSAEIAFQEAARVRDSMFAAIRQGEDVRDVFARNASNARLKIQETLANGTRERNIYREYSGTGVKSNSWVVRLTHKKQTKSRYFTDSDYGYNTETSHQAARDFLAYVRSAIKETGEFPNIPLVRKRRTRGIRRDERPDGTMRWRVDVRKGNVRFMVWFNDDDYDGKENAYQAAVEMRKRVATDFSTAVCEFMNTQWKGDSTSQK